MAVNRTQTFDREQADRSPTAADLVDRLAQFDGPPQQFLVSLLAVQCRMAGASAGAVLRPAADNRAEILAVFPPIAEGQTAPVWLSQAAELVPAVTAEGVTSARPLHGPDDLYGQTARRHLVMMPIKGATGVRGVGAFQIEAADPAALTAARDRLELTSSLLNLYEMRLTLQRRQADLLRLRMAMETLTAVNRQDRFAGAAMAFCNEVSARWQCERVCLGFLRGRYVRLRAMSQTEKFSRKMKLVQDIEAAMEECLDQDLEVSYPAPRDVTFVNRAAAELSKRYGPTAVVSFPVRKEGQPVAVLTVDRPSDTPFSLEEGEALRLTCDLCGPRLLNLHEQDRWIGAKAATKTRRGLGALIGPKHTWAKALAIVLFAALMFLIFAKGEYQAEAPFVLEAIERQVVPAPFDGFLKKVYVEPGRDVLAATPEYLDRLAAAREGQEDPNYVLATLDTSELRLQLAGARADRIGYEKQADTARRDGKTAEEQIAKANADKSAANIRLLEHRIKQARITTSTGGIVLTGELHRRINSPVKTGDILFEVAPLSALRADLHVPEDQISDVQVGQGGELATASYPDRRIRFVVEHINPVAEVIKQQNVFKLRVRLEEVQPWMRPGMEGVAKVSIGRRSYAWLWTRTVVNWLRMKLWL